MASPPQPDSFFGGSAKSASFGPRDAQPPVVHEGEIVEVLPYKQEQNYDTGEPVFWDKDTKLRPKWLLPIVIQTQARDDADDDGVRTVYVDTPYKGRANKGSAVAAALQAAGVKAPEAGGWLKIGFTHWQQPSRPGGPKAKGYQAEYKPPQAGLPQPPGGDPWAVTSSPTQPAAATPAEPAGPSPAVVQFLASKGFDASLITRPEQIQLLLNTFPDAPR